MWRQHYRGDVKWKPSYIITSCRAPAELACQPKVATAKANEGSGPVKGIFSLPMASFLKTTRPFPESRGSERSEKLPYKHTGKWSKLTRGTRIAVWCSPSKHRVCLCSPTWKHNHHALLLLIKKDKISGGVLLVTSAVAKITIKELLWIIYRKNPIYAFSHLKTVFLWRHADEYTPFRQQCKLHPEAN